MVIGVAVGLAQGACHSRRGVAFGPGSWSSGQDQPTARPIGDRAEDNCKTAIPGSIPGVASSHLCTIGGCRGVM